MNTAAPAVEIWKATATPQPDDSTADITVAIFSDALPERNGAGAYYHDLIAQLAPRVTKIEMFQPADTKRLLQFALPLPGDSTQKLITPNVFRLWRQFSEIKPDLVVGVTPGPFGLLGLFLARRFKTGFVTAFHTHFEELMRLYCNPVSLRIANGYLITTNKILCKSSSTVLVNNPDLVATVEKLGAKHTDVMGTPFPPSFLEVEMKAPSATLRRVLFAGRLAPEKNLPVVMDAARLCPDIEFVIAGDGPLKRKLKEQAADLTNVRFTGWLKREELCREMDEASILVLPSHVETFGTVALEAMARGRPALVAEGAGIHHWETLAPGLFSLRKGECIAEALRRLQELPPETWEEKAAAARQAADALNRQTISQWVDVLSRNVPAKSDG